jgi:hypothetical protein
MVVISPDQEWKKESAELFGRAAGEERGLIDLRET